MKRLISLTIRPGLTGLLIVLSLILAACTSSAATETPSGALPATGGETVGFANSSELGQFLVTPDGKTLFGIPVVKPGKKGVYRNARDSGAIRS